MKIVLALAMVFSISGLSAQSAKPVKIGHIETGKLMEALPEVKKANEELTALAAEYEGTLKELEKQLSTLQEDYQKNAASYTDLKRSDLEQQMDGIYRRMQTFQAQAQELLQKKQDELLRPIYEKIQKAIKEVGDEKGFTYILDAGALLYASPLNSEDILADVKKKLGI